MDSVFVSKKSIAKEHCWVCSVGGDQIVLSQTQLSNSGKIVYVCPGCSVAADIVEELRIKIANLQTELGQVQDAEDIDGDDAKRKVWNSAIKEAVAEARNEGYFIPSDGINEKIAAAILELRR